MDARVDVRCPYCGEPGEVEIDPGEGDEAEFVQDCSVCCMPWRVRAIVDRGGAPRVSVEGLDG